jgi:hypothetical protein
VGGGVWGGVCVYLGAWARARARARVCVCVRVRVCRKPAKTYHLQ